MYTFGSSQHEIDPLATRSNTTYFGTCVRLSELLASRVVAQLATVMVQLGWLSMISSRFLLQQLQLAQCFSIHWGWSMALIFFQGFHGIWDEHRPYTVLIRFIVVIMAWHGQISGAWPGNCWMALTTAISTTSCTGTCDMAGFYTTRLKGCHCQA